MKADDGCGAADTASPYERGDDAVSAIYVHCSGGAARQWRGLWERLPGIDHRGFDLIGHDDGVREGKDDSVSLAADSRAIDRIGPAGCRFHLIGHSYGGAVALRYALAHPERLLSLTLIEPSCFAVLADGDQSDREALSEIGALAAVVRLALRANSATRGMDVFVDYWGGAGSWSNLSQAKRERLIRMAHLIDRHFETLLGDTTAVREMSRLSVPTLVLCGTRSRRPSRAVSRLLVNAIDIAIHRSLPGADHMAAIAEPKPIASAMRKFLAAVSGNESATSSRTFTSTVGGSISVR